MARPAARISKSMLDIMMASYMAPGLSKVFVYEGYYPNDVLNRMATDNLARQLSSSWGFSPINATTEQIFLQYIAQGQSFFQASGDSGSYSGGVMSPSDDPNVTVVGGTSLTTSGAGGPWQSEATWPGSGGGISTQYPIPTYQQGVSMAANSGLLKMRNIPDVSLTADVQIFLIQNNGQGVAVGGTSAAAPLWAGFTALANQQATANGGSAVGFINPLIYAIGAGSNYQTDFHDVNLGNNGGFAAVVGYDLATGWGTPAGQTLINDLTNVPNTPTFNLAASPKALSLGLGASVSSIISMVPQNGFNGTVALVVSGLPSGVTAALSTQSTTGNSTLTLTASNAASPGTSAIVVTGTSGSLQSAVTITLTVGNSTFSLGSSVSSLTIPQGASASTTISVTPQFGFNASVGLAISSLPNGLTASFSPASTATTSVLTFTASSSAAPTTANVTITGTAGSVMRTVSVGLSVTVPGYSISASPASLKLPQGGSGTSAIIVAPTNGFSGTVSLAASGLPAGVTASFTPATASNPGAITLTASKTTGAGNATVTVTGTSGNLTSTTTIALSISAPFLAFPYLSAALVSRREAASTTTISVAPQNGFAGSVTLTVAGLPSGVTATFSPASTSGTSVLTFVATTTSTGSATATVTGTSGTLKSTVSIPVAVTMPDFTLTATATSVTLLQGNTNTSTISVGALNGFIGSVSFAVVGSPTGVTATFSPATATTSTALTFVAASTAKVGAATVTVTGTSGTLKHTSTITLNVVAPSPGVAAVNLASVAKLMGMVTDGSTFAPQGLDGGLNGVGTSYSANLLGAQQTIKGTTFYFGAANASNSVSGTTIPLPSGKFATLRFLATAVNGAQTGQKFLVTYTDGTTSTFTQSLSDWFAPQSFSGESTAMSMAYRDTSTGLRDNRTFLLYGYAFSLNSAKSVSSLTLPNNRNVVVLAITLGQN